MTVTYDNVLTPNYSGVFNPSGLDERQFLLDAGSSEELLIGEGTDYPFISVSGLDETPEIRSIDTPRANAHGSWSGIDWYDSRRIILIVGIVDEFGTASYRNKLERLKLACFPRSRDISMTYRFNNLQSRTLNYRPRRMAVESDAEEYALGLSSVALEMYCADPFLYSATQNLAIATFNGAAGTPANSGFFGSGYTGSNQRSITVRNAGNAVAPVSLHLNTYQVVQGELVNPKFSIEDSRTASYKSGDLSNRWPWEQGAAGIASLKLLSTIPAGQGVAIHMRDHAVHIVYPVDTGSGRVSRDSKWWGIPPGESRVTVTSDNTNANPAPGCFMIWRDTWI